MQLTQAYVETLVKKAVLIPAMEGVFRDALAQRDFDTAISCCRKYRVDDLVYGPLSSADLPDAIGYLPRYEMFAELSDFAEDEEYFPLVGRVWVEVEKYADPLTTELLFRPQKRDPSLRNLCMNDSERRLSESLPTQFTVFRGCTRDSAEMCSWTLDLAVARHFASIPASVVLANSSDDQTPVVMTGVCDLKDVLAVFTRWGEAEIVVSPHSLKQKRELWSRVRPTA